MGWLDYYKLLEKYGGDIDRATPEEMRLAARRNPDNPPDALALAQRKFEEKWPHYAAEVKFKKDLGIKGSTVVCRR